MAPLTWRNVDSPSFASANQMYALAANLLNGGIDQARKGLEDYKNTTTDEQSAALQQQIIAAGNDPAKIAAIAGAANPAFTNPAALAMANNQPSVLLDRQGKMLANTGEGILNQQRQVNVDTSKVDLSQKNIDNTRTNTLNDMRPEALAAFASLDQGMMSPDQKTHDDAMASMPALMAKYGEAAGYKDGGDYLKHYQDLVAGRASSRTDTAAQVTQNENVNNTLRQKDAENVLQQMVTQSNGDPATFQKLVNAYPTDDIKLRAAVLSAAPNYMKALPVRDPLAAQLAADGITDPTATALPQVNVPVANQNKNITDKLNEAINRSVANNPVANTTQPVTDNAVDNVPVAKTANLPDNYKPIIMNNRGTRNKPLSNSLSTVMSNVLPDLGLTAVVKSGGQDRNHDPKLKGITWTGSHRHDDGNAADVEFKDTNGHVLSWDNPNDVPKLQQTIQKLKEAGLSGFGAGEDYMGPDTTHIGYGDPAVWGSKTGKPYQALLDAYNNVKTTQQTDKGPTLNRANSTVNAANYQAAMDAVANGKTYEAPIDQTRPRINNPDNTVSTERTTTVQVGDKWMNIPTIVNGKQMTEEEALAATRAGNNAPVGVYSTVSDAEAAAQARSNRIGQMLDEASQDPALAKKDIAQPLAIDQSPLTVKAPDPTLVADTSSSLVPVDKSLPTTADTSAKPVTQTAIDESKPIKIDDNNTLDAVDPDAPYATQATQRANRKQAIDDTVVNVATQLNSHAPDWFTSGYDNLFTPAKEADKNASDRDAANKVADFWNSDTPNKYFQQHPDELPAAVKDPTDFANNFGKTPTTKQYQDDVKAQQSQQKQDTANTNQGEKPKDKSFNGQLDEANVPKDTYTPNNMAGLFSVAENTINIDHSNDTHQSLANAIQTKKYDGLSPPQAVSKLTGKDGPLSQYDAKEVAVALNELQTAMPNLNIGQAASLLEETGTYEKGYLYGGAYTVDTDKAKDLWKTYQQGNDASLGVASLVKRDQAKAQATQIATIKADVAKKEALYSKALLDTTGAVPDAQKKLIGKALDKLQSDTRKKLEAIYDTGLLNSKTTSKK